MLKMLIADDEVNIRTGIAEGVDWREFGIEVAAQAEDGEKAYEAAIECRPDILVLDIHMPFLDGLNLISKLKDKLPDSEFIVLTGYSEFEYAQSSVSLGVSRYLLKPISPGELIDAVREAKEKVLARQKVKTDLEHLNRELLDAKPILCERFVWEIIRTPVFSVEIQEKLNYFGISFPSSKFAAFSVRLKKYPERQQEKEANRQFACFAVKKLLDLELSRFGWGMSVVTGEECLGGMICFGECEKNSLEMQTTLLQNEITAACVERLDIEVSFYLGSIYNTLEQVPSSYRESLGELKNDTLRESRADALFSGGACDLRNYPFSEENQIIGAVKEGSALAVSLSESFMSTLEGAYDEDQLADYANLAMWQISCRICGVFSDLGVDFSDITRESAPESASESAEMYYDMERLRNKLKRIVSASVGKMMQWNAQNCRDEIEIVKKYIDSNYQKEITLKIMAEMVYMNPNYLCSFFKTRVGESLNSYTTRVRMEHAKSLLLVNDRKIFEIADAVGYSNTTYFSYAFKRYTGQTPSEFRESREQNVSQ